MSPFEFSAQILYESIVYVSLTDALMADIIIDILYLKTQRFWNLIFLPESTQQGEDPSTTRSYRTRWPAALLLWGH